jgi:hypothetical protein
LLDRRPIAVKAICRDCSWAFLLGYGAVCKWNRLSNLLMFSVLGENIEIQDNDNSLLFDQIRLVLFQTNE